jgi:threonine dehydrogenase-like Zn-dependent dehydrogenase
VQSQRHPEDFKFVMKVLREGKFNTAAYITKTVDFETILTAFDDWASSIIKRIKVVTVWD